nr:hypothetical protein [Tanacetum cinerariifolium]
DEMDVEADEEEEEEEHPAPADSIVVTTQPNLKISLGITLSHS